MSTQTTNIGLTKPSDSEAADITAINGDMDIIDAVVGAVNVQADGSLQAQVNALNNTKAEQSDVTDLQTAVGDVDVSTDGDLQTQVDELRDSVSDLIIEKPFSGTTNNQGNLELGVDSRTHYMIGLECAYRTFPHVYSYGWFVTVINDNLAKAANVSVSGTCYLIKRS